MGLKFGRLSVREDLTTMKKLDFALGRSTCLLVCCLLLIGQVQESRQLTINSINVPELVREGELDYVILDCDYDLGNSSTDGLVVKWWQNNDLVYMWHVGREPAADPSSTHIDVGYKVSDDPFKMYRAMKFNNPNITLSGIYKCMVFNYKDTEANAEAPMLVYSIDEKFELLHKKTKDDEVDGVDVTCQAEGLYPQPVMDISINDVSMNGTTKPEITKRDDGKYDIIMRIALDDEDLSPFANIKCTLEIPMTDYRIPCEFAYYPGTPTTTPSATTKLLRTMEIQAYDSDQPNTDNGGGNATRMTSASLIFVIACLLTLRTLAG